MQRINVSFGYEELAVEFFADILGKKPVSSLAKMSFSNSENAGMFSGTSCNSPPGLVGSMGVE
jgi:hypothetical protein